MKRLDRCETTVSRTATMLTSSSMRAFTIRQIQDEVIPQSKRPLAIFDAFELPAAALSPPASSAATTPSGPNAPNEDVTQARVADLAAAVKRLQEQIGDKEGGCIQADVWDASFEAILQGMRHVLVLVEGFRQHVYDKKQPRDGAYQDTHGKSQQQFSADNYPAFMADYFPPPEAEVGEQDPNESQGDGVRYCKVGLPKPKKLHPKYDNRYRYSLCDKHATRQMFLETMGSYQGKEERTEACKCK
jgi:hypothetical protein